MRNLGLTAVLSEVELNQTLDTETYTALPDAGSTASGTFITFSKDLPAVPAQCGDTLRLRVAMTGVDGGYFDEFGPGDPVVP